MVRATVHKDGDRFLIEVSPEDARGSGLEDGQEVRLTFSKSMRLGMTDKEFDVMVDRIIDEHREALEYLADH